MSEKTKAQKYEETLMDVFAYSHEALHANARGVLTFEQRAIVSKRSRVWSVGIGIYTAIFILALVFGALIFRTPAFWVVMAISALIGAGLFWAWWRINEDAVKASPETIEGRVVLDVMSQGNAGTAFIVKVGDQTFSVNKHQFLALKNGDPYRLHYLRRTKKILSIEWLLSDAAQNVFVDESLAAARVRFPPEPVDLVDSGDVSVSTRQQSTLKR